MKLTKTTGLQEDYLELLEETAELGQDQFGGRIGFPSAYSRAVGNRGYICSVTAECQGGWTARLC